MAAGSMGNKSSQSKVAAFYAALGTPWWITVIETTITMLISVAAIVFLCAPLFTRLTPSLFVILTYASILMGIVSLGIQIRVVVAGIRRQRIKFLLYSLVPLILSYFLFMLSIVLVNGYAIHAITYWQYSEQLQSIHTAGIDRLVAIILTTFHNAKFIWVIFVQFTAWIIAVIVWIANIHNLIKIQRQIRDYDSMVTFPDGRLWFLGGLFAISLVLSLIIF